MKTHWILLVVLASVLILSACNASAEEPPAPAEMREVTLGLGFIPNVQFAPLYVAQKKGFYAEEGLDVALEYGFENDFVALTAQGERDFAMASGDQLILARSQGLPITYVMKWYERYPVALMLGPEHHVDDPAALSGVTVGLPGLFGANFIGWKALVYGAGLDEAAVKLEEIGFTQAASVQQGVVDGAMVYIANEPIQLRNEGVDIQVIEVSDYVDLISNGLVTSEQLIAEEPELVQKMVRATLRGIQYTIDNPDEAFAIVREVIPEMTDTEAPIQKQVLEASIALWRSNDPGVTSAQAWQHSIEFMQATGLLPADSQLNADSIFSNQFVPGQ